MQSQIMTPTPAGYARNAEQNTNAETDGVFIFFTGQPFQTAIKANRPKWHDGEFCRIYKKVFPML